MNNLLKKNKNATRVLKRIMALFLAVALVTGFGLSYSADRVLKATELPEDEVTAEVVLTQADEQERYYTATLEGKCTNQDGIVVAEATCRQLLLKRFFEVLE